MVDRPALGSRLRDERGQGHTVTALTLMLVIVLLLGIALFVTKVRPAQVSVAAAARDCTRQAGLSLDPARGLAQAYAAAEATLASAHLDPARATITVTPLGAWGRATEVRCEVTYSVSPAGIPFGWLFAREEIPIQATYTTVVEPWKSRWGTP